VKTISGVLGEYSSLPADVSRQIISSCLWLRQGVDPKTRKGGIAMNTKKIRFLQKVSSFTINSERRTTIYRVLLIAVMLLIFNSVQGYAAALVEMENGLSVRNLGETYGKAHYFTVEVSEDVSELAFEMAGGTGDADIYVRYGAVPTLSDYDYRPYMWGNDETVEIVSPEQGPWYVMIHAYDTFDGVTLDGYSRGLSAITLSADQGEALYFEIDVPEGVSELGFEMYGGTGDADIHVMYGSMPTLTEYYYRPYMWGNDEIVEIQDPPPGTWYIMINAYDSFDDVTLKLGAYEDLMVSRREARLHAVADFLMNVSAEVPVTEGWDGATLRRPSLIFDPSGEPLFYEFPVMVGDERVGRIKAAANKALGTTVVSLESGSREHTINEALSIAVDVVRVQHGYDIDIIDAYPMAYGGLDLGIAVTYYDVHAGTELTDTLCISDFEKVPPERIRSTLAAIPEYEIESRVYEWCKDNKHGWCLKESLNEAGLYLVRTLKSRPLTPAEWVAAKQVVKQYSKPTWQTVDLTRCKSYVDKEKDFCARTTLQMVNYFYKFYKGGQEENQYSIDKKLKNWGYDEDGWRQAFFKYLTQETGLSQPVLHFAGPDKTWLRMRCEIDANRPFIALWSKYGDANFPDHMNFAMGYNEVEKTFGQAYAINTTKQKYLGIYDTNGTFDWVKIYSGSTRIASGNLFFVKFITAKP